MISSEVPGWLVTTLEWAAIRRTVIATSGAILTVGFGAALHALRETRTPEAKEALMRTVENDQVALMRHNAAKSVVDHGGQNQRYARIAATNDSFDDSGSTHSRRSCA